MIICSRSIKLFRLSLKQDGKLLKIFDLIKIKSVDQNIRFDVKIQNINNIRFDQNNQIIRPFDQNIRFDLNIRKFRFDQNIQFDRIIQYIGFDRKMQNNLFD